MKKVLAAATLLSLATLGIQTGAANAWHYGITATGRCQTNGSYKITWKIDNSDEDQPLEISDAHVYEITDLQNKVYDEISSPVHAGDHVKAHKTKTFNQVVDGTKTYTYGLVVTADWSGDRKNEQEYTLLPLDEACEQPAPKDCPPVTTPTDPTPPTDTPPVDTPPTDTPPTDTPPTDTPPVETPPTTDTPPVVTPVVTPDVTTPTTPTTTGVVLAEATVTTKTPVVAPTQVAVTPVGAVNAGEAPNSLNTSAIAGLIGSSLAIAFSLVRFAKRRG